MTKLTMVMELVRLTEQSTELAVILEQARRMVDKHFINDMSDLGIAMDDLIDKSVKVGELINDKIIKLERKLGF